MLDFGYQATVHSAQVFVCLADYFSRIAWRQYLNTACGERVYEYSSLFSQSSAAMKSVDYTLRQSNAIETRHPLRIDWKIEIPANGVAIAKANALCPWQGLGEVGSRDLAI